MPGERLCHLWPDSGSLASRPVSSSIANNPKERVDSSTSISCTSPSSVLKSWSMRWSCSDRSSLLVIFAPRAVFVAVFMVSPTECCNSRDGCPEACNKIGSAKNFRHNIIRSYIATTHAPKFSSALDQLSNVSSATDADSATRASNRWQTRGLPSSWAMQDYLQEVIT